MQNIPPRIFHDVKKKKFSEYVITFKIEFTIEDRKADRTEVEIAIFTCLNELHGQKYAAYEPTLIAYNQDDSTGKVKVSSACLLRLWSALTLTNKLGGDRCAFRISSIEAFDNADES